MALPRKCFRSSSNPCEAWPSRCRQIAAKLLRPSGGDGDIRRLVEQAALPAEALTILDAANPAVMPATASGVEPLIAATGRILATIRRNEPSLYVGAA